MLAIHGGISHPYRTRSRLALSLSEREEISRGLSAGGSLRSIARLIDRSVSTVSREVNRNGDRTAYTVRTQLTKEHRLRQNGPSSACLLPTKYYSEL